MSSDGKLLDGLVVLDFCNFLSGPFAALRLGDLGARVIKVERSKGGDLCRKLYLSDTDDMNEDSTLFHTINRGKESFAADLKNPDDMKAVKRLIAEADVLIQNFRPGVIERLGLGYEAVQSINPRMVYATITGFGGEGPWAARPGQDLLAQARSGLMWLNGDADQGPLPFGLAIADVLAGGAIVQGILAALVKRGRTGRGSLVETSLLEVLIDFQFEVLTTHLNDGGRLPPRGNFRNAHAYLSAPYGIYPTSDGYIAIAMTPLDRLAGLLDLPQIAGLGDEAPFRQRDDIKRTIASRLTEHTTEHWLSVLEPDDIWCAGVLEWEQLLAEEGFRHLDLLQSVSRHGAGEILTTRSPIRVDGVRARVEHGGPALGEHNEGIRAEFQL